MYLIQIFLIIISHLLIIFSQQIEVIFNTTVILDNSTINWNNFNICQCAIASIEMNDTSCVSQTTSALDLTVVTTVATGESLTTITESNYSDSSVTSMITTNISAVILYSCVDGSFGIYCNISSDICDITNPCFNGGTCYSDHTLSLGYSCQCPTGFSGYDCDYDNRVCTGNTCWNNGVCTEINTTISGNTETSFLCQCIYGYEGTYCELESDMCGNITCQYNGICLSSYLTWSCQCLDASLYSGAYCQDKSSALVTKQIISRSLAVVAIVALCCVVGFVITMDILKYVFKIDPVDRERYRLRMEKEKNEQKKLPEKKKKKKKKAIKLIVTRFSTV